MIEQDSETEAVAVQTVTSPPAEKAEGRTLDQIIVHQLKLLQVYYATVLESDEPEAIHKMRVTTRRLQATLDLLHDHDDRLNIGRLKKQLRKRRQMLSSVRNYDVFLELIEKESSGRSAAYGRQFEPLKAILQQRRGRRIKKVRKYLLRAGPGEVASTLGVEVDGQAGAAVNGEAAVEATDIAANGAGEGKAEIADEKRVATRSADRIEQRLGEFQALAAQSHPTTDPADLHQLRIAAKRLRYLLENVSEMGYGDASRALMWLRTLQDRIGDWHDLEALETEILEIVSRRKFMKAHLAESSRLLQAALHLQRKKETLVSRLFPVRVPLYVTSTSNRLTKALRRKAARRRPKTKNGQG